VFLSLSLFLYRNLPVPETALKLNFLYHLICSDEEFLVATAKDEKKPILIKRLIAFYL